MRTALFWAITQRVVIISYRRFGPTYPSLEDQRSSRIGGPVWCGAVAAQKVLVLTQNHYDDVRITKFTVTLLCCLRGSQVIHSRRMYTTTGCVRCHHSPGTLIDKVSIQSQMEEKKLYQSSSVCKLGHMEIRRSLFYFSNCLIMLGQLQIVYVVCPKRKCTDFSMYEMAT